MAIEDGGTLGHIFDGVEDGAAVATRLALFHEARYARAARVQVLSSVRAGKEKDVEEKLRQYSDPPGSRKLTKDTWKKFTDGLRCANKHDGAYGPRLRVRSSMRLLFPETG